MSRILVAEDRDISRELIESVLTSSGYEVVLAEDGKVALARALECPADLVILDLYMPFFDGFEVLERLRSDSLYQPHYSATPILALTASAMAGDRDRALTAGFTEYISKPVNISLLRATVARLLSERLSGNRGESQ